MPVGERLLRLIEHRLMPWFDRNAAEMAVADADKKLRIEEAKGVHTEEIRQDAIAARIDAEHIRKAYRAAGSRLTR